MLDHITLDVDVLGKNPAVSLIVWMPVVTREIQDNPVYIHEGEDLKGGE